MERFSTLISVRYENYCREVEALKKKLKRNLPAEKKKRLKARLDDLEKRLIPELSRGSGAL